MTIHEVQVNAADPKVKTAITGTITAIQGAEQTSFGPCQKVICDGLAASFWPGKGQLLTEAELHKPMQIMCKARVYQGRLEYSLSRPFSGGAGGRFGRSPADYTLERAQKNRAVGLSYCLEYLKLPLDQAYMRALQIAQFIETGQTPFVAPPTPSKREPGEDDPQDSIPY